MLKVKTWAIQKSVTTDTKSSRLKPKRRLATNDFNKLVNSAFTVPPKLFDARMKKSDFLHPKRANKWFRFQRKKISKKCNSRLLDSLYDYSIIPDRETQMKL